MLKLKIEDFIFEVKEEIISYEELGQEKADLWEKGFLAWLDDKNANHKNVKKIGETKYFIIQDESEIFDIADEFFSAIEQNNIIKYWRKFK